MAMVRTFRELEVWRKSMALAEHVYRVTRGFPREEVYGLTSQLRRAAVSVPSNIAEGQSRNSTGEFIQFLGTAKGSLSELMTQTELAGRLALLGPKETEAVQTEAMEIAKMLNGLVRSLRAKSG